MFENDFGKSLDRRSFLRGSALFAGVVGLSVVPAAAAQQAPEKKKEEPKDPFASGDKKEEK